MLWQIYVLEFIVGAVCVSLGAVLLVHDDYDSIMCSVYGVHDQWFPKCTVVREYMLYYIPQIATHNKNHLCDILSELEWENVMD